jgi:hypothetical protein
LAEPAALAPADRAIPTFKGIGEDIRSAYVRRGFDTRAVAADYVSRRGGKL